jgi:RsiW-degrading membrane proteinase PrsW (M82 family)
VNTTAQRIAAAILGFIGLLAVGAFASALALADNRNDATESWGSIAGFGLFATVVALFWILATLRQRADGAWRFWTPPLWLSVFVFGAAVGGGFALRELEHGAFLAPALAVVGFIAVAAFFLRIAARWMPRRRVPGDTVLLPGLWGALVSPVILMVLQGSAVALLLAAAVTGIYLDNPDFEFDPNLDERISAYFEDSDNVTSTVLPEIVATPTIALFLFVLLAVIAPLSEELVKATGAILVLSKRAVVSRGDAFMAGAGAGLGFGVMEGLGYTLMAPSAWQQVILMRAPVVVLHVAATTIVTLGWFRMRERGRGFLPYFAIAVLFHAAWNSMALGFVLSLAGLDEGADPSAGRAAAIGVLIVMLGLLFVAACLWFILSARRAGKLDTGIGAASAAPGSAHQLIATQAG